MVRRSTFFKNKKACCHKDEIFATKKKEGKTDTTQNKHNTYI